MTQSGTKQQFNLLSDKENQLAREAIDIAFKLHKALGPGLLERRDIPSVKQQLVPIYYEGFLVEEGLRLDILVDDLLILELKAQENFHPVWEAQLLSYLKLTGKRIGYIINFTFP